MSDRALLSSFWVRPCLPRLFFFPSLHGSGSRVMHAGLYKCAPSHSPTHPAPAPGPAPAPVHRPVPCRAPAALRDSTADVDMLIVGCRTLLRPEENPNVKHTQATLAAHPVHPAIPKLQIPDLLKLLDRHCAELQDAIEHDDEEQSTRISTLLACMAIRAQVTAITAS